MEAKIYFTIKLVCAVFIFRQLWIFIFNREMCGIWEKAYRLMRISPHQSMEIPEETFGTKSA